MKGDEFMNEKKQNKVLKWIKKHLTRHVMMGLGGVILVIALILGVSEYQSSQVKTTKSVLKMSVNLSHNQRIAL